MGSAGCFPVVLDLSASRCLVVGGGVVALRKVRALLEAGAAVSVVAPRICRDMKTLCDVEAEERAYRSGDLEGVSLVIAATDDSEVNRRVAADARSRGIPVNVVDKPELCTVILPSVLRRGKLMIAVSTSGAAPSLAARLRRELERRYPEDMGSFVELLGQVRLRAIRDVTDPEKRRRLLHRLSGPRYRALLRRQGVRATRRKMLEELRRCALRTGRH